MLLMSSLVTQVGRPIDYTPSPLGEFSVESLCNRAESALTNAEAIQLMVNTVLYLNGVLYADAGGF